MAEVQQEMIDAAPKVGRVAGAVQLEPDRHARPHLAATVALEHREVVQNLASAGRATSIVSHAAG